jgi:hypothetical protein
MPWLGSIYLTLFATIGIASAVLEYREGTRGWRVCCDSLAKASLVVLFFSYWHGGLRDAMGWAAPMIFILAMIWETLDIPQELHDLYENPELFPLEKRLVPVFGIGLCIPVYIFAGLAAVR